MPVVNTIKFCMHCDIIIYTDANNGTLSSFNIIKNVVLWDVIVRSELDMNSVQIVNDLDVYLHAKKKETKVAKFNCMLMIEVQIKLAPQCNMNLLQL